jgi:hypothetical protein
VPETAPEPSCQYPPYRRSGVGRRTIRSSFVRGRSRLRSAFDDQPGARFRPNGGQAILSRSAGPRRARRPQPFLGDTWPSRARSRGRTARPGSWRGCRRRWPVPPKTHRQAGVACLLLHDRGDALENRSDVGDSPGALAGIHRPGGRAGDQRTSRSARRPVVPRELARPAATELVPVRPGPIAETDLPERMLARGEETG